MLWVKISTLWLDFIQSVWGLYRKKNGLPWVTCLTIAYYSNRAKWPRGWTSDGGHVSFSTFCLCWNLWSFMCVCVCACTHVCLGICACMFMCMRVHMYVWVSVNMYVCAWLHVCICVCTCMCVYKPEINLGCHFSGDTHFLSFLTLPFTNLDSELRDPPVSVFQIWGYKHRSLCPVVLFVFSSGAHIQFLQVLHWLSHLSCSPQKVLTLQWLLRFPGLPGGGGAHL